VGEGGENLEKLAAMPLDPAGLSAAVGSMVDDNRVDWEAEQAELFASAPLAASGDYKPAKRMGRPPGALNKTTDEWRAYFLRHYRSPLFFLGDLIAADPFALHAAIVDADQGAGLERSVSVLAVINAQRAAAEALAPYVHRKQPIAIDAGEDKSVPLIQMVQVGADGLAALFPQRAGIAQEFDAMPAADGDEVASAKSPAGDEGGPSA
jgi:hypothetical protein